MSSFDKSWKTLKKSSHRNKSKKRSANQVISKHHDRSKKRRRLSKRTNSSNKMFTPQNVPLWIAKWNSMGGYSYWKDHFANWQEWCDSALSLDRSNVSDAKNERALIDRFSKPERYMKHRKMGLKELQEEGQGWDEFLIERMIQEKIPMIEIRDVDTGSVLHTASVPRARRHEIANNTTQNVSKTQSMTDSTYKSKDKRGAATLEQIDIDAESEDPYSASDESEQDSDESDSDVQVLNNGNNSNNHNGQRRRKPYMKGSINSIDDAIEDYSEATGRDIKFGANDDELFDVENVMVSALKKAKIQRTKEIKAAKKKDKDQFTEMMETIMDKCFEAIGNGTIQSQLFAMSMSAPLEVCFFQWCQTKFAELMEHYAGEMNSFNDKISNLMEQSDRWQIFLKQWMFWRIMTGDDTALVLTKIECFQNDSNILPPLIGDQSEFMNDMLANIEVTGTDINNNNSGGNNANNADAQNQSPKNGKAEIDD